MATLPLLLSDPPTPLPLHLPEAENAHYTLTPIEVTDAHLGILLSENQTGTAPHSTLEHVQYVRTGDNWVIQPFSAVELDRMDSGYIIRAESKILPLPSLHPFHVQPITLEQHRRVTKLLNSPIPENRRQGLNTVIELLSPHFQPQGLPHCRTLTPQKGYADQVEAYQFIPRNKRYFPTL